MCSTFVLFLLITLSILAPLHFPVQCILACQFLQKDGGVLTGNVLSILIYLCRADILTILCLLIHVSISIFFHFSEQCLSFYCTGLAQVLLNLSLSQVFETILYGIVSLFNFPCVIVYTQKSMEFGFIAFTNQFQQLLVRRLFRILYSHGQVEFNQRQF